MIKRFSLGTAIIAIAASMTGTANAQDALPSSFGIDQAEAMETVTDVEIGESGSAGAYAYGSDTFVMHDDAAYSTEVITLAAEMSLSPRQFNGPLAFAEPGLRLQSAPVHGYAAGTGLVTPLSVAASYGNIDPFYGNINPFYGNISAFWRNINPFYGNINPFYRNINPFYGNINPFYGNISAFWGNISPFTDTHLQSLGDFGAAMGTRVAAIEANWSKFVSTGSFTTTSTGARFYLANSSHVNTVFNDLQTLIGLAEAQVGAEYRRRTGKSFRSGLATEVFARHGINPNSAFSLTTKTEAERAAFYLDWNDTILLYSGVDIVDHWGAAINWTPSLTQIQGDGRETVIGIIDGSFSTDTDLSNNIVWAGGYSTALNGHGAGVASLIAGAHDGVGVLGIAPNVNIATFNPFDSSGTTNWGAVANGILALQTSAGNVSGRHGRASIINLSLGEQSLALSQGLADVLASPDLARINRGTIYVVAAGNDGVSQTRNINWNGGQPWTWNPDASIWEWGGAQVIVVGSIDIEGQISSFSNRPGTACLTYNSTCYVGSSLANRFIVAPGSLVLVSDGNGGVVRRSGTSFAAPLVSGAISLLHDRWPWLANHPHETADIIFRSARDLGAPGVDPIYGHGLLDVTASQSPLDFSTLNFRSYRRSGTSWVASDLSAASVLAGGIPAWWNTADVFFTLFETIGNTRRDFAVPVSAFSYGGNTNALGRQERFQDFISQRFTNWINSSGADRNGDGKAGFSEVRSSGAELNGEWSLRYDAMVPTTTAEGTWRPTHAAATLSSPNGTMALTVGHGQGAMALSDYRFGLMSDHDPSTGGANPVLGLASGESFLGARYQIARGTNVKVGYSQNRESWEDVNEASLDQQNTRRLLGDRPADAFTLDIEQKVSSSVSLGVNYTRLKEYNALLGTQTGSNALLGNGSSTDAMTVSASIDVGRGFSFDVSATGAHTETADGQLFANSGKILSTAGQVSATKRRLLTGEDSLRLSVAQPLQIEEGALQFRSDQVINRDTGEIGEVVQTFSINTKRRLTGEAIYALPLTNSSELGVFGRYVSGGNLTQSESYIVGGNFSLRF